MMLCEDFLDGYLELYNKPKVKKSFWQKFVYAIKKPIHDNITRPMRWKLINLSCLLLGHKFKLLFRPDFRKNHDTNFHFFCERCCAGVNITFKKEAS